MHLVLHNQLWSYRAWRWRPLPGTPGTVPLRGRWPSCGGCEPSPSLWGSPERHLQPEGEEEEEREVRECVVERSHDPWELVSFTSSSLLSRMSWVSVRMQNFLSQEPLLVYGLWPQENRWAGGPLTSGNRSSSNQRKISASQARQTQDRRLYYD